jgi:hypothetical protein
MGNHPLTGLMAFGIAGWLLMVDPLIWRRWRLLLACAGLLAAGMAVYLYIPIRANIAPEPPLFYAHPRDWDGFRYLVFAEQFRGTFRAIPGVADTVVLIARESWQQLGLLFPLAGVGLAVCLLRRRALMLLLGTWFGVNWWFALGYINADIGRYYLVPLLCVALLGGVGAGALLDLVRDYRARLDPRRQTLMGVAALAVAAVVLIGPPVAAIPARLPEVDQSTDVAAREWLDEVGAALPANAVVVSWWSFSTTLWYGQYVEGWRPDVTVIDDRTMIDQDLGSAEDVLDRYVGQRPLYLIRLPSDLPRFRERYELVQLRGVSAGPVYEVRVLQSAGAWPNL